jgi:hypothetical protein
VEEQPRPEPEPPPVPWRASKLEPYSMQQVLPQELQNRTAALQTALQLQGLRWLSAQPL